MTKIVFMGTPAFAVPILEGLLEKNYEVQAVVTQPDRPVGRKKIMTPPPVKEAALKHHLEVLQPAKLSGSPAAARLHELAPDLIITAAFGQFLPDSVLNIPRYGVLNVHASLLPRWRGGAPVHYALIAGDQKTGVTLMKTVKKMDAGDIYAQAELAITPKDNVGTLFEKLSILGRDLLLRSLPLYLAGKLPARPQEEALITIAPNIKREQEILDFQKTAKELENQVRGMCPWPVAYTTWGGKRLKVWLAKAAAEKTSGTPGEVLAADHHLTVACGGGTVLELLEVQPAGKGKMSTQDFLNGVGRKLEAGEVFGQ